MTTTEPAGEGTPAQRVNQRRKLPAPERASGVIKDALRKEGFRDVNLYRLVRHDPQQEVTVAVELGYVYPMVWVRGEYAKQKVFYRELSDEANLQQVVAEVTEWVGTCNDPQQ